MIYTILYLLSVLNIFSTRGITVERPLFVDRNSDALEIEKIVLGDRETVLYLDARFCDGKLDGVDSTAYLVVDGKEYPLHEARGVVLSKCYNGSVVQQDVFELIFPPIPGSARTMDIFLSKGWRKMTIWGVELQKGKPAREKMIPAALRKRKLNDKTEWQSPVFNYAPVKLDIRVVGYKPGMPDIHSLTWEGLTSGQEKFLLDEQGKASVEFNLAVTSLVSVHIGKRSLNIVVDPGEKATLYIDLGELNLRNSAYFRGDSRLPSGYFVGNREDLNQRLLSRTEKINPLAVRWDKNKEMTAEAYVDLCLREYKRDMEQHAQQEGISEEYRRYQELESRIICLRRVQYIARNFLDVYGWKPGDERVPKVGNTYLKKVAGLGLDDYDLALLSFEPFEYLLRNFDTDEEVKECAGSGYVLDLYKSRACRMRFQNKLPLLEEHVKLMSTASPSVAELFKEMYIKRNEEWAKHLAKPGYQICEKPDVPDEKLLDAILATYKGKVVLLDFWGIRCVPCLEGIRRIKPLKKELKGKDIVYVYISLITEDSGEVWNQMVPDIGGYHYGLPRTSHRPLIKQLGITGVPYYMIFDREGKVKFEHTGFPGCDRMRELLLQEL